MNVSLASNGRMASAAITAPYGFPVTVTRR
jgi:hypothetical protein